MMQYPAMVFFFWLAFYIVIGWALHGGLVKRAALALVIEERARAVGGVGATSDERAGAGVAFADRVGGGRGLKNTEMAGAVGVIARHGREVAQPVCRASAEGSATSRGRGGRGRSPTSRSTR